MKSENAVDYSNITEIADDEEDYNVQETQLKTEDKDEMCLDKLSPGL